MSDASVTPAFATRPARRIRLPTWALPWLGTALVLAAFEFVGRTGILFDSTYLPTLPEITRALVDLIQESSFWRALADTLTVWLLGFLLAAALAVPLGIAIGTSSTAYRSTRLPMEFVRPIPGIAVLPLAVLVWGTGVEMGTYVVAFGAFFPLLFQSLYGVQDVDPVARDTARAYGLSRPQIFIHVSLPSATPYIATGVRLAATMALVITVAQELLVGSAGLGQAISQARYALDIPTMYALIVAIGLVGLVLTIGLRFAERRLMHWHSSQRIEAPQ